MSAGKLGAPTLKVLQMPCEVAYPCEAFPTFAPTNLVHYFPGMTIK